MTGVRSNDRHHLPIQRGELRGVQIFIHFASQRFGIALIPLTRDRRRTEVGQRVHKIIVAHVPKVFTRSATDSIQTFGTIKQ